jgi:hypothetical protein
VEHQYIRAMTDFIANGLGRQDFKDQIRGFLLTISMKRKIAEREHAFSPEMLDAALRDPALNAILAQPVASITQAVPTASYFGTKEEAVQYAEKIGKEMDATSKLADARGQAKPFSVLAKVTEVLNRIHGTALTDTRENREKLAVYYGNDVKMTMASGNGLTYAELMKGMATEAWDSMGIQEGFAGIRGAVGIFANRIGKELDDATRITRQQPDNLTILARTREMFVKVERSILTQAKWGDREEFAKSIAFNIITEMSKSGQSEQHNHSYEKQFAMWASVAWGVAKFGCW